MQSLVEFIEGWDRKLFLVINNWHSPFFDQVMWHLSGKLEWVPLYMLLIFLLYKKFGNEIWKILIGVIAVIALTDQLSVHLFKEMFERYRPCHNIEISHLVHSVNDKCGGKFGFVSSHAANTFGLATYVGILLIKGRSRWILYTLLLWAALVSYSRIYLGVHYPADVFCGALLGIVLGYLVQMLIWKVFRLKLKYDGI